MIKVNDTIIKKESFGDGTLKCNEYELVTAIVKSYRTITCTWCYDDDSELFLLWCIVKFIRNMYSRPTIFLKLPYIPNARQDRKVSERLFSLKYFAEIINLMRFDRVYVLDPHSDVSMALFDNVEEINSPFGFSHDNATYMFPDAGAAKKYCERYHLEPTDNSFIIGAKHRNADGRIAKYELLNFTEGTKKVIIRDDICSYGGTFVSAAKELRKRGVEEIILVVSHCENNILKGEVFDYIDKVYTTDSICTVTHPKLYVEKIFRGE